MAFAPLTAMPSPDHGSMTVFERRALSGTFIVAMPAAVALAVDWIAGGMGGASRWIMAALVAVATLGLGYWQYRRLVFPLYSLTSLLEALREGDYNLRGSSVVLGDAIYDVKIGRAHV